MPLEGGPASRVRVELRHRGVLRDPIVDPGAFEAAREDEVLRRPDHPLPREVRHGGEGGGHCHGQGDPGDPPRQEERCRYEPEDEDAEGEATRRRPRSRELRLDPLPQRARDGVDPRLVRKLAERQDQRERQRRDDPDRGRDERARQAGVEPDDEADEPQREEVEPVAVVKPVEAPRAARERGDHEEPGDVRGGEQRHECGRRPGSGPPDACQCPEHDRRDRDRNDREVDGEVPEVVDEPLPTSRGS